LPQNIVKALWMQMKFSYQQSRLSKTALIFWKDAAVLPSGGVRYWGVFRSECHLPEHISVQKMV
jgi:hypothetical protein